jgi:hypothetical protein
MTVLVNNENWKRCGCGLIWSSTPEFVSKGTPPPQQKNLVMTAGLQGKVWTMDL